MRLRGKSIRRKIVVLLAVPLVSLASLWTFATTVTLGDAGHLLDHSSVMDKVGDPAEAAIRAVQRERRQVMVYLADPRRSDALTAMQHQQRRTDAAVSRIREHTGDGSVGGDLPAAHRPRLRTMLEQLAGLDGIRVQVEENTITREDAFDAYNGVVDPSYRFLAALHMLEDTALDKQGRAVIGTGLAREFLAREDALMAGALAAGHMTDAELRAFSDRVAERRLSFESALPLLPDEDRRRYEEYWEGTSGRALRRVEEAVVSAGARRAVAETGPERWEDVTSAVLGDLRRMNADVRDAYRASIEPAAFDALIKVALAGVLGALALLVSLFISLLVGRGLVRDLNALRKQAHEASAVRLPSVMRRLAAGDDVDVEAEVPRQPFGQDEMGQVGHALNSLQRSAVTAAVKQSEMRKGVSEVFVNLARRSQVLLHRQLTLLDTMERRTEDADELADLFRLDHLTTRMRRHAEGLVILSGAAPSRQWRKPVQLMDVVRAAVAEVEDYERIEVRRLPRLAVDGPAVADLTHLLAELIENATVFSPPHTAVQVLGERVPSGYTLEIHDRGLGMTADGLLEANLRLAETPEFELSDTDRLGLFVVSRLARRQDVRVSLQESPYGGTTAVVLIPGAILTEMPAPGGREEAADDDGSASDELVAALAQRPLPLPERSLTPMHGPVELEAPVEEEGEFTEDGDVFVRRRLGRSAAPAEQHQQASDGSDSAEDREPARPAGPVPLPRRGTPVLVAEHGRPVPPDRRARAGNGGDGSDGSDTPEAAMNSGASQNGPEPQESRTTAGRRSAEPDTTVNGLPRRVRQANLAPQLRASGRDETRPEAEEGPSDRTPRSGGETGGLGAAGGESSGDGPGREEADWEDRAWQDRDAEEVRARMASLQQGWQRGREAHSRQNAAEPGDDPQDAAASGTTPEGDGR